MNEKIKNRLGRFANFGYLFLLLIPIFAIIYYLMPDGYIDYGSLPKTIIVDLYFSVATITTLGYGDITPITEFAAAIVGIEAILGVVVAGLFLNQIARHQTVVDALKARESKEKRAWARECDKMLQYAKVIKNLTDEEELVSAIKDFILTIDMHDWRVLEHVCTKYVVDRDYKSFCRIFPMEIEKIEKQYQEFLKNQEMPVIKRDSHYWS